MRSVRCRAGVTPAPDARFRARSQPYIYAVIYWGSKSGAAGAGLLTGLIVFVLVPLLGLLAYWLVFLRRARLARESFVPTVPACAPPEEGAGSALGRLADRHRWLRVLPLLAALVIGASFAASTPLTVLLPRQYYWQSRVNGTGAVVPYISDTGANRPAYFPFSAGLTAGGLLLLAGMRLVYERMDPHLAALDAMHGRYGRRGELLLLWDAQDAAAGAAGAGDDCCAAPAPEGEMARVSGGGVRGARLAAEAVERPSAPLRPSLPQGLPLQQPCWCSTGRWRHCCVCCTQSLRQQGRSAFIAAVPICLGMPLLGWCAVSIEVFVHSFGAAAVFACAYLHLALLARLASARIEAAALGGPPVTGADAFSAKVKALLTWLVPISAAVLFIVIIPACGASAGAIWNAYLAPLFEWYYAGLLFIYLTSLMHEAGLPPPPEDGKV